jgi:hypothetical protein
VSIIHPPITVPWTPRHGSYNPHPVEVWQENTEGEWVEVSDVFVADRVEWRCDARIDRAFLHVQMDELEPPMTDVPGGAFRRDYLQAALNLVDPNRRVRVIFSNTERDLSMCRFQGYPVADTLSWGPNPRGHDEGLSFQATGVMDHWVHDVPAQIIGRWVHQGPLHGAAPSLSQLRHVQSAPCVFNADGKPNCSPYPVIVEMDLGGEAPQRVPVYVFASPHETIHRSNADTAEPVQYWSYGRALLYLLYVHGVMSYTQYEHDRPIELPSNFIQNLVSQEILGSEPKRAPDGTPLARSMWGRPNSLECNNTNLHEALSIVASKCGAHFHVEYALVDEDVVPRLKMWVDGQDSGGQWPPTSYAITRGVPRKAPPRSDLLALRQNRAMGSSVSRDWEQVTNTVIIAGGDVLHESDYDLVPGWTPLLNLDRVAPNDADDAKEYWRPLGAGAVGTAGAKGRYRRSHADHEEVRDVGRKWVLNETGQYLPEIYSRQIGGPPLITTFDDAAYAPFDPGRHGLQVLIVDPEDVNRTKFVAITPGSWARRPRPFGNLTRPGEESDETAPIVSISFDSGSTWQVETRVEFLEDEAAIRFASESPLDITPIDPTTGQPKKWWEDNYWYAVIDDRFRVRVTATIEDDDLVIPDYGRAQTASGGPIDRQRVHLTDDRRYRVILRHWSMFSDLQTGPDSIVQQDLVWASAHAGELAQLWGDRQPAIRVTVPWLDGEPEISHRVSGIYGINVALSRAIDRPRRDPQIIGIDYELTPFQRTSPIVGDYRDVVEPQLEDKA